MDVRKWGYHHSFRVAVSIIIETVLPSRPPPDRAQRPCVRFPDESDSWVESIRRRSLTRIPGPRSSVLDLEYIIRDVVLMSRAKTYFV